MRSGVDENQAIAHVVDTLLVKYADTHDADYVEDTVHAIHERFDGQPIRDFVPLLVERTARDELGSPVAPDSP